MTESLALYEIKDKLEAIEDTLRDLRRDIGGSLAGHTEMIEQALHDCAVPDTYRGGYWDCNEKITFTQGDGGHWVQATSGCRLHLRNGMLRIFYPHERGEVISIPVMSITKVNYALHASDF